jgi:hypothetical protein
MNLVVALLLPGCWNGVDGNGQRVEEPRALSGFSAVDNQSNLDVSVERGDTFAVVVSIDEDLLELVELRVDGDTLHIDTRESIGDHVSGPSVRVTMPSLLAASVHGSGNLDAFEFHETAPVRLSVSGSADMDYDGSAPALTATVRGSGNLHARGTTDRLEADVSGSGDLDARDLIAASASLSVASRARVTSTSSAAPCSATPAFEAAATCTSTSKSGQQSIVALVAETRAKHALGRLFSSPPSQCASLRSECTRAELPASWPDTA